MSGLKRLSFPPLVRIAMLGAATGCRSQLGLAALALTQPSGKVSGPARILGGRRGRAGVVLGAAGELVIDQLPKTPSRLEPAGLISRVALGGLGGALLGQRLNRSRLLASVVGAGAATATTYGGATFRRAASRQFGRDTPGALAEDVVAIKLAWLAVSDDL